MAYTHNTVKSKFHLVETKKVSGVWYAWLYHTPERICAAKSKADAVRAAFRTATKGQWGQRHWLREIAWVMSRPKRKCRHPVALLHRRIDRRIMELRHKVDANKSTPMNER